MSAIDQMLAYHKQEINTVKLEMDYYLMCLFDAMQEGDESKIFDLKAELEAIRLELLSLGYFKWEDTANGHDTGIRESEVRIP